MNSGKDWNNSYLLTVQLEEVLNTRYPEMASMFSVQIEATDSHVKEVNFIIFFSLSFHKFHIHSPLNLDAECHS